MDPFLPPSSSARRSTYAAHPPQAHPVPTVPREQLEVEAVTDNWAETAHDYCPMTQGAYHQATDQRSSSSSSSTAVYWARPLPLSSLGALSPTAGSLPFNGQEAERQFIPSGANQQPYRPSPPTFPEEMPPSVQFEPIPALHVSDYSVPYPPIQGSRVSSPTIQARGSVPLYTPSDRISFDNYSPIGSQDVQQHQGPPIGSSTISYETGAPYGRAGSHQPYPAQTPIGSPSSTMQTGHSATDQALNVFMRRFFPSFPAQDSTRELEYRQPYDDQVNYHRLGIRMPADSHNAAQYHTHASTYAQPLEFVPGQSAPSSTEMPKQLIYGGSRSMGSPGHFLDPRIQALKQQIEREPWRKNDRPEPRLTDEDAVVQQGLLPPGSSRSRFDLFIEKDKDNGNIMFYCTWIEGGQPCAHKVERRERALGHARDHFHYKPYFCEGSCGKRGCTDRYTCQSFLSDHIRRRLKPSRVCPHCKTPVTTQNLKRHLKTHEQTLHSPPASSPSPTKTSKRTKKKSSSQNGHKRVGSPV